jgi:tetratricopeptide (TPR) repeat protein
MAEAAIPTEAQLRGRIAHDEDPTPAALALVRQFDAEERLPEALQVLETALERKPSDSALRVARAGVLRDLGRRREAAEALAELLTLQGPERLHPGLLFELAELQTLEGNLSAANATLRMLRQAHGNAEWTHRASGDLTTLDRAVESGRPVRLLARDLLGNLRGAPLSGDRLSALRELVRLDPELAARAVAIAGGDLDPEVRAESLHLAVVDAGIMPELVAAGLADRAPQVRLAAVQRAHELAAAESADLLLAALASEQDAGVFTALHGALHKLDPHGPELKTTVAEDPAARAVLVAAWRQRWTK